MTIAAKNFNVTFIIAMIGRITPMFDVMSLKVFGSSATLTLTNSLDDASDNGTRMVRPLRNTTLPEGMILATHLLTASYCRTLARTIKSCFSAIEFYLELFTTYLAYLSNLIIGLWWSILNPALNRAVQTAGFVSHPACSELELFSTCTGSSNPLIGMAKPKFGYNSLLYPLYHKRSWNG